VWQKKFTLNGLAVAAVMTDSSLRIESGDNIAHGSDPNPPALDTAMANALPCTPAIGAWMIGNSIPRSSLTEATHAIISGAGTLPVGGHRLAVLHELLAQTTLVRIGSSAARSRSEVARRVRKDGLNLLMSSDHLQSRSVRTPARKNGQVMSNSRPLACGSRGCGCPATSGSPHTVAIVRTGTDLCGGDQRLAVHLR